MGKEKVMDLREGKLDEKVPEQLWSIWVTGQERGENMHILIFGQGDMRGGCESGVRSEHGRKNRGERLKWNYGRGTPGGSCRQ